LVEVESSKRSLLLLKFDVFNLCVDIRMAKVLDVSRWRAGFDDFNEFLQCIFGSLCFATDSAVRIVLDEARDINLVCFSGRVIAEMAISIMASASS
jgi:hypothetical protein